MSLGATLVTAAPAPTAVEMQAVDQAILGRFPHLAIHGTLAPKCVGCHVDQLRDLNASIHGQAGLLKNLPEGAVCLTCHESNHFVNNPQNVAKADLIPAVIHPVDVPCMRCHQDQTIAKVFLFAPHVPSEFEQSIHFRKAMLGDKHAPLCFDCHGAHSVRCSRVSMSELKVGERSCGIPRSFEKSAGDEWVRIARITRKVKLET